MKNINSVFKYAGIAAAVVYIALTFVSHLSNTAINPINNWLSDYGSPNLNPSGYIFYNLGCILTALLLAVFYIGITKWYIRGRAAKKYAISYICAQISGFVASCSLIIAALFPIGTSTLHSIFSIVNQIGINCFLSFMAVAVFLHPAMNKVIGILGIMTSTFNIITMNAFTNLYIAEWIYFALFITCIVLITVNYGRFSMTKDPEKMNTATDMVA